jgi:hypothetical protein
MDEDRMSGDASTGRQTRHLRRVIAGVVAAVASVAVVGAAVLVLGTGQQSGTARTGTLASCPALNPTQKPNIPAAHNLNWSGCDLTGADLSGADLTGSNLSYANLTGASIKNAVLTGVTLDGIRESSPLIGQPLSLPSPWLWVNQGYLIGPGVDLSGQDLSDSGASAANLANVNLTKANLTGANLLYVDFTKANFTNAVLTGATFVQLASGSLVSGVNWYNATCPNGFNSIYVGHGSCIGQGGGL